MINSDFHRSADSTSERTGHCPLCWTYSKSDDYCSSFEEAIASTAERPMGCPWFTSEDRANWRARHKSSDGEPSNGKQPLMASRPAPPVPSDQTFHVAQSSQVRQATIEECANLLAREYPDNANTNAFCAAIRSLAAQPPAAPVETERKTFTIPPGHEAVRDSEGRATGEVRPRLSAATDEDPTASKEWNEGCDFALEQLGKYLGIDLSTITWDGATETVEGDVDAVIGNILRAKFGEDWGPDDVPAQPQSSGIRHALERAQKIIERDYPNGQLAIDIRDALTASSAPQALPALNVKSVCDICTFEKPPSDADARLMIAAPALFNAMFLLEKAEEFHANCEECNGEDIPELCENCFPHYDEARVARRLALAAVGGSRE